MNLNPYEKSVVWGRGGVSLSSYGIPSIANLFEFARRKKLLRIPSSDSQPIVKVSTEWVGVCGWGGFPMGYPLLQNLFEFARGNNFNMSSTCPRANLIHLKYFLPVLFYYIRYLRKKTLIHLKYFCLFYFTIFVTWEKKPWFILSIFTCFIIVHLRYSLLEKKNLDSS